jgi:glutamyl-tRNA(Gln) amidotransferase subunit E
VVKDGSDLIAERGMASMGPLMGAAMSKVRGKAQPQLVQKLLLEAIKAKLE